MTKINKNAPVFPNPALSNPEFLPPYDLSGLTKREYFAAMAMQGFASWDSNHYFDSKENMAEAAVKSADSLIAELEKT